MRKTGFYDRLGHLDYFLPYPLPPKDPVFEFTAEVAEAQGKAMFWLGRLNGMAQHIPDIERFVKSYIIKEALLSSEIEGIKTTITEVFTHATDSDGKPSKDTQLVLNYTRALEGSLALLKELPLSNRVILKMHELLMNNGGEYSDPGNFRKQTVRVGALVPPPPQQVPILMADLERFINTDKSLPAIINAGLAHVQFETIHPFLDGNGRIGRMLITLMLMQDHLLSHPVLYISYFFKKHQMAYYQRLDAVRVHGDFEGWTAYYLNAVYESSRDACERAQEIIALDHKLQRLIESQNVLPNKREQMLQVLKILFSYPVITMNQLSQQMGKSYTSASNMMDTFVALGVLQATGDQQRNKLFTFRAYLDLLEKEYTFVDSPEILFHP